jgi:LmbE family N-acetylglucosaminyl deacetylase
MSTAHSANLDLPAVFRALVEGNLPIGPVALVVAHPDDEVTGVGGQLERWRDGLVCIHATDGAPSDGRDARSRGFHNRAEYVQARSVESCAALCRVGIGVEQIRTLDFPDQELAFSLSDLDRAIDGLLAEIRPAAVITHAFEGGHPDHDALALVLASVIRRWRGPQGHSPVLVEFAGYWEDGSGSLATNRFAPPQTGAERQLRMSTQVRRRKKDLLGCYRTQQHALQAFDTREEWIRPAPDYDFRVPPNLGRVWYDQFEWSVRSDLWMQLAAAYLDRAPALGPIGVG